MPSSRCTETTMPPFAVPSSLVRTTPVTSTASVKTRACTTPFWPVVASSTSSTSLTGACFSTTRLTLPSSSIRPDLVCSRPAVSMTTVSTSASTPVRTASKATDAGSPPSRPRTVRTPTRSPQVSSWSAAAARKVSAAPRSTLLPSPTSTRAILPTVVVLPAPLTPTTRTTPGSPSWRSVPSDRSRSGPRTAVSSSTSSSRRSLPEAVASTSDLVRSRSTIWVVAATPTSAARRSSSTSSQSSSVSFSRARTVSRPRPSEDCDRASRERSRTRRPADGGGVSKVSPGSGSAGGSSTVGGVSGWTTSGWSTGGAGSARGSTGRGRVSVVPAAASSSRRVVRRPRPTSREIPVISATTRIARAISTNSMRGVSQQLPPGVRQARGMPSDPNPPALLLGPLLRHVDPVSATVWVETDRACEVDVLGRRSRTFGGGGHPSALVVVEDLEPGSAPPSQVPLDGVKAWPPERSAFPPSRIRTPGAPGEFRIAFGSCRYATPGTAEASAGSPPDALDCYATRIAGQPEDHWPDALVLLGDQVYADELTPPTRRWLSLRRGEDAPPEAQVADFEEYTRLYAESWSDPHVRWLLSTVPSSMIFDDHEMIDDWNTSAAWRREVTAQPWWADRISGGLVSYWVYQHLGNLSPQELADNKTWQAIQGLPEDTDDAEPMLRDMAERADTEPGSTRWSFVRHWGESRLIMIDSRAGGGVYGERRRGVGERPVAP